MSPYGQRLLPQVPANHGVRPLQRLPLAIAIAERIVHPTMTSCTLRKAFTTRAPSEGPACAPVSRDGSHEV